ncbi:MAG: ABC transporter permease [Oligoflexales bacterium]|nr:ABC transporter permease [Oligoflexales bacterium]
MFSSRVASYLGNVFIDKTLSIGQFSLFVAETFVQMFRPPFRFEIILQQIDYMGRRSLDIVLLSGFFTGAVFGLQLGGIFQIFGAEALMGGATGKALTRELAPLMVAFLTSGRTGSAMTAEIATMKVNEQVEAMESMAVDPISYLVVPRVLATAIIMPLLCIVFIFIGIIGAYVVATSLFEVDVGFFIDKIRDLVKFEDIYDGLIKSFIFSFVISFIACRVGLRAAGGAKGVGNATTQAVVLMLLTTLAFDFVITYIQFRW